MPASRSLIVWGVGIGAIMFCVLSQAGGPMCFPDSFFQPGGLLWHLLAGVMAVLLYFYRRAERTESAMGGEPARQRPMTSGRWSANR